MKKCKICKNKKLVKVFEYSTPPIGETNFGIKKVDYKRYYLKCSNCKHWFGKLKIKIKNLYSSAYSKATYNNLIKKNFDKINNLPDKKSDNFYRVNRIDKFIKKNFKDKKKISILDIGSGLGIFPYKITKKNYECTALDPDKNSCLHIKNNLGIKVYHGDYLKIKIKKKFDLITLNKVIEHVKNPQNLIAKSKKNLKKNGFIYIEVPDEKAKIKGKSREEFFIDHLHVFSKKSLSLISEKLRLKVKEIKSIIEPSTKFTIFAFLSNRNF